MTRGERSDGGVVAGTAARPRLAWVDIAKAVSIFFVVSVHAGDWLAFTGVERGPVLEAATTWGEYFRMPVFFAASGVFAARWLAVGWRELLNRRLATLIWVFVTWQVVMFAYKYLAALTLPGQRDTTLGAHLLRVVLSPLRPNAELWFLWALVVFFLVGRLLHRLDRRWVLGVAALVSVTWSSWVLVDLAPPGSPLMRAFGAGLQKAPMFLVFFLFGAYAGPWLLATAARVRWWQAVGAIAVFAAATVAVDRIGLYATPGVSFAHQVLGLAAGLGAALLLARIPGVGRGLAAVGRRTLAIYVVHSAVVVVTVVVLWETGLSGLLVDHGPAAVLGLTGLGFLAGLALHRVAAGTALLEAPPWFRPGGRIAAAATTPTTPAAVVAGPTHPVRSPE